MLCIRHRIVMRFLLIAWHTVGNPNTVTSIKNTFSILSEKREGYGGCRRYVRLWFHWYENNEETSRDSWFQACEQQRHKITVVVDSCKRRRRRHMPPRFLAPRAQLSVDNVGQRGGGCLGRGRLEKGTGMAVGALLFVAEFVVVCAKSAATVCARIGLFTWKT